MTRLICMISFFLWNIELIQVRGMKQGTSLGEVGTLCFRFVVPATASVLLEAQPLRGTTAGLG